MLPDGGATHKRESLLKLSAGAIGVVFGDIGTSPIYAFRETFAGHHPLRPDNLHVMGVLSLIFWSMMVVVTVKYVTIIMRADNKGEGGSLALLALVSRSINNGEALDQGAGAARRVRDRAVLRRFDDHAGDLGAVCGRGSHHGRAVGMAPLVIPIAVGILIGLFALQARGTARMGALFGPIMLLYFAVLAVLGEWSIMIRLPSVLLRAQPLACRASSSPRSRCAPSSPWDRSCSR